MCAEFFAHLDKHQQSTFTMMDQKTKQHVGFTAVFQSNTYSERLPWIESVFTAERDAIKTALTKILEANRDNESYTIFLLILSKQSTVPEIRAEVPQWLR